MKTKLWVLTILVLFIVSIGFATETPKMNVVTDEDNKIQVTFEAPTACPVEITITDNRGDVVYYWQSEYPQNEVNQSFNLAELGNGTFNLALKYGCTSINREVTVSHKEVKVGPPVKLPEPFFCYKNDKLNVSFLNVSSKNVYLNVYKNGEHYNGFKLGKNFDIQKCIDFSMAENGNYEIVLTDYFKDHHYMVEK